MSSVPVTLDCKYTPDSLMMTSLRHSKMQQLAPNNPEIFYPYACVLAPEAFDSGTHLLETIHIGLVTIKSNQRKEHSVLLHQFYTNVWCVWYEDGKYFLQSPENLVAAINPRVFVSDLES